MAYQVTATRQGAFYATVTVDRPNALCAIARAEEMLKVKPVDVPMSDNGEKRIVMWTGLDFTARRIN